MPWQVYKGRLHTGEIVAVKVQRPYVLETVTVDLYIIRSMGMMVRKLDGGHLRSMPYRGTTVRQLVGSHDWHW